MKASITFNNKHEIELPLSEAESILDLILSNPKDKKKENKVREIIASAWNRVKANQ